MRFSGFFSGFLSIAVVFSLILQGSIFLFPAKKVEASAGSLLKDFVGAAAAGLSTCVAAYGSSVLIQKIRSLDTVPGEGTDNTATFALEGCLKPAAAYAAQQVLAKLLQSTVNWINTGLDGNPFYIRDLGSYLASVEDESIRSIVYDLKNSNSPYANQLSRALASSHTQGKRSTPPDFTLDKIVGADYQAFSDGDFTKGGWNAWLATTIIPQNNPIGASILAANYANETTTKKVETNKQDLAQNDGFLSVKTCVEPTSTPDGPGCDKYETQTPGSVISEQLKKVSLTGQEQLQNTDDPVSALMNSVFTKLFNNLIQKGVSSLSTNTSGSGSSFGSFGSYGSNQVSSGSTGAGSGGDWINAGVNTNIVLEDLNLYKSIQQSYIQNNTTLISALTNITPLLYKADFCVPGPSSDWYPTARSNLSEFLSSNQVDMSTPVKLALLSLFGVDVNLPLFNPGYGEKFRAVTIRALEGGNNVFNQSYQKGYKDFINERFPPNNVSVASAVALEFSEKDTYALKIERAKENNTRALGISGSLDYLLGLYNALPPISASDPDTAEREKLQTRANSLLYNMFRQSDIDSVKDQYEEINFKIIYVNDLIAKCEFQVNNDPSVNKERRPYPQYLLPPGTNYPVSATFLPDVVIGPFGPVSSYSKYILINDYFIVNNLVPNPSVFEDRMRIY